MKLRNFGRTCYMEMKTISKMKAHLRHFKNVNEPQGKGAL